MGVDIGGIARGTRLIHDVGLLRSNPADRLVGLIWVQMALGIPGMMLLLRCTIISIEVGVHGVMAVAGGDRDRNRGPEGMPLCLLGEDRGADANVPAGMRGQ